MRIAVNTRMLQRGKLEGIGYFCLEAFRRIPRDHPEHEFLFIFDRPYDPSFVFSPNITPVAAGPPARHPLLWYLWYEWSLPRVFAPWKPDLFVSPDGYLSLRSGVPGLAVIHDINFEHYPGDLPFFNRTYYRRFFPRYAREATRIATVSQFSRDDISRTYRVPEEKIDVVYNGVNDGFVPLPEDAIASVRQRLTGGAPYFLFIGSIHRRKNIVNLLKAFDRYRHQRGDGMKLVFAGTKRWWTAEMEDAFRSMTFRDDVIFTGRLEEQKLFRITAAAFALTYVSTFEGFGIPLLEAMRCGVPVLTADVTSMPEVAGDSALLVDPFSVEAISDGMQRLANDDALRKELTRRGLVRSREFSWDRTARDLWHSIERALSGNF
jgi:glycosyltransferase involved in cell wall biosynthesis